MERTQQKDAKSWSSKLYILSSCFCRAHAPFLRSALQTGAACLKLALACDTSAFPDIGHVVLLRIQQRKNWITLIWEQNYKYIGTHIHTCVYNGQYNFVSKYAPIPFTKKDNFWHHREEDYGFSEIYVCRCLPSNKLYIILSSLHRFQTPTYIAGIIDRFLGGVGARSTQKRRRRISRGDVMIPEVHFPPSWYFHFLFSSSRSNAVRNL